MQELAGVDASELLMRGSFDVTLEVTGVIYWICIYEIKYLKHATNHIRYRSLQAKWINNEYNYDTHNLFNSYPAANIFWQKKEQCIKAKYYSICTLCNP